MTSTTQMKIRSECKVKLGWKKIINETNMTESHLRVCKYFCVDHTTRNRHLRYIKNVRACMQMYIQHIIWI